MSDKKLNVENIQLFVEGWKQGIDFLEAVKKELSTLGVTHVEDIDERVGELQFSFLGVTYYVRVIIFSDTQDRFYPYCPAIYFEWGLMVKEDHEPKIKAVKSSDYEARAYVFQPDVKRDEVPFQPGKIHRHVVKLIQPQIQPQTEAAGIGE